MSSRVGLVANVGPRLASAAGIRIEDFIVDCRFMNDVCNLTQLLFMVSVWSVWVVSGGQW